LPGGAHTQLLRYYGAAYPAAYRGSLFLDNWGRHGFAGANRAVFRYVPDDAGRIVAKEPFLWSTDPHFRPAHIALDPDGNMLVADWYGRDDESDLTGRIWRVRYVGKDAPKPVAVPDPKALTVADAVAGLGSPSHRAREVCTEFLLKADAAKAVPVLSDAAAKAPEALGAANALWLLGQLGTAEAKAALGSGAKHADAKVRRLAVELVRRYKSTNAAEVARSLAKDENRSVQVAAALALPDAEARKALVAALSRGGAGDEHLRYEAAWHLARLGGAFQELLADPHAATALAGLIAVDVACYENFPTKPEALAALKAILAAPASADPKSLLTLVQMHGDVTFRPAIEALLAKPDLPPAVVGRALLFLRAKGGPARKLEEKFAASLADAVDAGTLSFDKPDDLVAVFALLEAGGPTPAALKLIGKQLGTANREVRDAAHALARRFGPKAEPLAKNLWAVLGDEKKVAAFGPEAVATLARIEPKPDAEKWRELLAAKDAAVRTEAVRAWRAFKGNTALTDILLREAPALLKADPELADDLGAVTRALELPAERLKPLTLPAAVTDKEALARDTAAALAKLTPAERTRRAVLGQQAFERASCTKCHTTATQTTELAPSLKGIGGQKIEYLVESVLHPSKVIKLGFEAETVRTTDSRTLTGLVRDDGDAILVLAADATVRVLKADIEKRTVTKLSVMPEGLDAALGRREFEDLIAYLASLK
jgi:putative heme-binding domain-containing protein